MNQGDWFAGSTLKANSGNALVSSFIPNVAMSDSAPGALAPGPALVSDLNVHNTSAQLLYVFLVDSLAVIADGAISSGNAALINGIYRLNAHDDVRIQFPGVGKPHVTGVAIQVSTTDFPTITTPALAECFFFINFGLYRP